VLTRRLENFTALPDSDKRHPDAAAGSTRDSEVRSEPGREDAAPGEAPPIRPEPRPGNDDLLDYRARAAACRAKAEKAGEHTGEASTWLQVAAMWDGLADRLENKAPADPAPLPPSEAPSTADAAPATALAPASEVAARREGETEAAPPPEVAPQPAAASPAPRAEAAPRSRGLRRAAIAAGLLVLVAVPVLWWRTGERASGQRQAGPQAPAVLIEAPPNPAKERPAPPAQAAPTPVAPPAAPNAIVPPALEPAAAPPAPAPASSTSETAPTGPGSEPVPPRSTSPAQGAVPEPGDAGPSPAAQPASATPQAAASEPRADAPVQLGPILGTWWADACPKPAERRTAVPMVLGEDRARAGAASCTFQKKTQAAGAAGAWSIVARCSDGSSSWTAHIRLTLTGKRLSWSSERGTQTYVRCP
jgi:hypothetical protein